MIGVAAAVAGVGVAATNAVGTPAATANVAAASEPLRVQALRVRICPASPRPPVGDLERAR